MNVIRSGRFASCLVRAASILVLGVALTVSRESPGAVVPSMTGGLPSASKAMLLLPEPGETPYVWNEWIRQQFNNQCPLIRDGVVFGELGNEPGQAVHCYRMEWGANERYDELEAAWAAIDQRHPQTDLVIMAHGQAGHIAAAWLNQQEAANDPVYGLLVIGNRFVKPVITNPTRIFNSPRFQLLLGGDAASSQTFPDSEHAYRDAQMDFNLAADNPASARILERGADINRVLALWLGAWWGRP